MKTLNLLALAFLLTAATQPSSHVLLTPGRVAVEWFFSDTAGTWDKGVKAETRVWLEIRTFNGTANWEKEGFNPSFSYLLVRDYVPMIKDMGNDRYQITFKSKIAGSTIP